MENYNRIDELLSAHRNSKHPRIPNQRIPSPRLLGLELGNNTIEIPEITTLNKDVEKNDTVDNKRVIPREDGKLWTNETFNKDYNRLYGSEWRLSENTRLKILEKNKDYQFIKLVAGFANVSVSDIIQENFYDLFRQISAKSQVSPAITHSQLYDEKSLEDMINKITDRKSTLERSINDFIEHLEKIGKLISNTEILFETYGRLKADIKLASALLKSLEKYEQTNTTIEKLVSLKGFIEEFFRYSANINEYKVSHPIHTTEFPDESKNNIIEMFPSFVSALKMVSNINPDNENDIRKLVFNSDSHDLATLIDNILLLFVPKPDVLSEFVSAKKIKYPSILTSIAKYATESKESQQITVSTLQNIFFLLIDSMIHACFKVFGILSSESDKFGPNIHNVTYRNDLKANIEEFKRLLSITEWYGGRIIITLIQYMEQIEIISSEYTVNYGVKIMLELAIKDLDYSTWVFDENVTPDITSFLKLLDAISDIEKNYMKDDYNFTLLNININDYIKDPTLLGDKNTIQLLQHLYKFKYYSTLQLNTKKKEYTDVSNGLRQLKDRYTKLLNGEVILLDLDPPTNVSRHWVELPHHSGIIRIDDGINAAITLAYNDVITLTPINRLYPLPTLDQIKDSEIGSVFAYLVACHYLQQGSVNRRKYQNTSESRERQRVLHEARQRLNVFYLYAMHGRKFVATLRRNINKYNPPEQHNIRRSFDFFN